MALGVIAALCVVYALTTVVRGFSFPPNELDALWSLYNSTDGVNWNWKSTSSAGEKWDFSQTNPNPCSSNWQGITCSSNCATSQCHVTSLQLPQYGLKGPLPSELSSLTDLDILDLAQNSIKGSIPQTLFDLSNLVTLQLYSNQLTGTIAASIGQLVALKTLQLHFNKLNGSLPTSIGSIDTLVTFQINNNELTGTIPLSFGQLSSLQLLGINSNNFFGPIPAALGNLLELQALYLNQNQLTGSIPSALQALSKLQYYYLHSNALTGPIPPNWSSFRDLEQVSWNSNLLNGTIPSDMGTLTKLQYLYLEENDLSGTIPAELSGLSALVYLSLNDNRLNGTIPPQLSELPHLASMYLYSNRLTGTIPRALCSMTGVTDLDLELNALSGPVPSEIGGMTSLQLLSLHGNRLNGSIPAQLGQLAHLSFLDLSFNRLTGTIPAALGSLTKLTSLDLSSNAIRGSIPPEMGKMYSLESLTMVRMRLNCSLPSELGKLISLQTLDLYSNELTGTIPASVGDMSSLTGLYLYNNHLNGTLPPQLFSSLHLTTLFLDNNRLSGELPPAVGYALLMEIFTIDYNRLRGSLPVEMKLMLELFEFSAAFNELTGGIDVFGEEVFLFLTELNLQHNNFTGTLGALLTPYLKQLQLQGNAFHGPLQFHLPLLETLDVSDNAFSGCLPWNNVSFALQYVNFSANVFTCSNSAEFVARANSSLVGVDVSNNRVRSPVGDLFRRMTQLETLSLANNAWSGAVADVVDPTTQSGVTSLDLSQNLLVGSLPTEWFAAFVNLTSLVVVGNCVTGAIPTSVCEARNLTTLVLDGMGSNAACAARQRTALSPWSRDIYTLTTTDASLPACVFSRLPALQTLHLSGLGLYGSLPAVATLPASLAYLSLAHNRLTGDVPHAFLRHDAWAEFDVSFNRLRGTLVPWNASDASVRLLVNRLSGSVPAAYDYLASVDMLTGNLFACALADPQLPPDDPAAASYICGANHVELLLAVAAACFAAAAVVGAAVHVAWYEWFAWTDFAPATALLTQPTLLFSRGPPAVAGDVTDDAGLWALDQWLRTTLALTAATVLVLLPAYGALTATFGSVAPQYLWAASAVYLTGVAPAAALMGLWMPLVGLVALQFCALRAAATPPAAPAAPTAATPPATADPIAGDGSKWRQMAPTARLAAYVVASGAAVLAINGGYVYAWNQQVPAALLALLTLALSCFKLASNALLCRASWFKPHRQSGADLAAQTAAEDARTHVLTGLLCFNNVVVPLLTEALVDTDCFLYATLQPAPSVVSDVALRVCRLVFNPRLDSTEKTLPRTLLACATRVSRLAFQPPFLYNFSCSAALVTNFAGVFALRFVLSGVVLLVAQWAALRFVTAAEERADGRWPLVLAAARRLERSHWALLRRIRSAIDTRGRDGGADVSVQLLAALAAPAGDGEAQWRPFIDPRRFAASFVVDLLVLLTFGVLFPPLALLVGWSLAAQLLDARWALVELQRLATSATSREAALAAFVSAVDADMRRAVSWSVAPLPGVVALTVAFWAFAVFDTLGDAAGIVAAGAGVAALAAAAVLVWLLLHLQHSLLPPLPSPLSPAAVAPPPSKAAPEAAAFEVTNPLRHGSVELPSL